MAKSCSASVQKKSQDLEEQVKQLAAVTTPVSFPAPTGYEIREDLEVRRTEKDYRQLVARRVWTRLSKGHRAAMRKGAYSKSTFYSGYPKIDLRIRNVFWLLPTYVNLKSCIC